MSGTKKISLVLLLAIVATSFPAPANAGILNSFFGDFFGKYRRRDEPNIVEYVVNENEKRWQFDTLIAAVTAVSEASLHNPELPNLLDVLSNGGPFTLFAPTDKAFDKLPDGTVETLLMPQNLGTLADILLYHATPGKKTAGRLLYEGDIEMLNGDEAEVDFSFWPFGVFVNDAKVIDANNRASNGIIHVINNVLLPPDDAPPMAAGLIVANIPEPSSLGLVGTLLLSVVFLGNRRNRTSAAAI